MKKADLPDFFCRQNHFSQNFL